MVKYFFHYKHYRGVPISRLLYYMAGHFAPHRNSKQCQIISVSKQCKFCYLYCLLTEISKIVFKEQGGPFCCFLKRKDKIIPIVFFKNADKLSGRERNLQRQKKSLKDIKQNLIVISAWMWINMELLNVQHYDMIPLGDLLLSPQAAIPDTFE